jgi:TetR/AcrR family transcriptional regulator of autoinduction and epiphytic fitness
MTATDQRTDGRTERSRRTRDAVVRAMLQLINEGELKPTARQVSATAGVSLRTVFQHFEDLEALFAAAAREQADRLTRLITEIPTDLPFEERLSRFVALRANLLETETPVRRSALLQAPFSAQIRKGLKLARDVNRDEMRRVFAAELVALHDRDLTKPALFTAAEWYVWETLRHHEGLTIQQATGVMSHTVRVLLRKEKD